MAFPSSLLFTPPPPGSLELGTKLFLLRYTEIVVEFGAKMNLICLSDYVR